MGKNIKNFQMFFLLISFSISNFLFFFPNQNYNNITMENNQIKITNSNYYITNCMYHYFSSSTGSPIHISTTNSILILIETSSFLHCYCSTSGGGIYFSSTPSECILNKICAFNCTCKGTTTNSGGSFTHVKVGDSKRSYILDSTIAFCINPNQYITICFIGGNQIFQNINSSYNNAKNKPGLYNYGGTFSNMTFCTIFKNIGTITIGLHYTKGDSYINLCNIMNNSSPSYGVVYNGVAQTIIQQTFFKDNSNTLLVIITSGTINVFNSTIYHSFQLSNKVISFNNPLYLTNSYQLNHFYTELCPNHYLFVYLFSNTLLNYKFVSFFCFFHQIFIL